jgi:hypothetical protein
VEEETMSKIQNMELYKPNENGSSPRKDFGERKRRRQNLSETSEKCPF